MKLHNGDSCYFATRNINQPNEFIVKPCRNATCFDFDQLRQINCSSNSHVNLNDLNQRYELILVQSWLQNKGCKPVKVEMALCQKHAEAFQNEFGAFIQTGFGKKNEGTPYELKGIQENLGGNNNA